MRNTYQKTLVVGLSVELITPLSIMSQYPLSEEQKNNIILFLVIVSIDRWGIQYNPWIMDRSTSEESVATLPDLKNWLVQSADRDLSILYHMLSRLTDTEIKNIRVHGTDLYFYY